MKIIAVMNLKGGVGKTTVTALLAERIARNGQRVLAVDTDPQCDLSTRFIKMMIENNYHGFRPQKHPGFDPKNPIWAEFARAPLGYWSTAQLLGSGYAEPYATKTPNLSIIPSSTQDLIQLLHQINEAGIQDEVVPYLAELLSAAYFTDHYDVIVIDTPPQTSPINRAVLRAATHLVIPTELIADSLNAVSSMISVCRADQAQRGASNPLSLASIIPVRYNPRASQQTNNLIELQQDPLIAQHLAPPMRAMISYQADTSDARTKSILDLHPKNQCRKNALQWLDHILAHTTQENTP